MTFYDAVKDYDKLDTIEVRTNSPNEGERSILFGYCGWDGNELYSLDGDSYYLDEEIETYSFDNKTHILTVWIYSEWISG